MNYINTYIIKKFDISNYKIEVPLFYNSPKDETKLAYLLLKYLYFQMYNKILDFNFLCKDNNRKPIFFDNSLYFNISHCREYLACSLGNVNMGIDIEQERIIKNVTLNKIKNIKDININPIQIWNIKEAYSKYLGIGLKLDFSKISIDKIKEETNLISSVYYINNKNIYFSLCYDKIEKNFDYIKFIDKDSLIDFYKNL